MALMESALGNHMTTTGRAVVAAALAAGCVFGLVRSLRPDALRFLEEKGGDLAGLSVVSGKDRIGHHPECDGFRDHVIWIGTVPICAGCTGLALGCIFGLVTIPLYLQQTAVDYVSWDWVMIVGFVFIGAVFAETARRRRSAEAHMLANVVLVMGLVAVTFGSTEYSASVYVGLLAVVFSFLWMDTRIRISEIRHARICAECPRDCKAY